MFYFEFRILNPDLKSIFVGSILKEIFECIVRVFLNSFCLYISIFAIFNLKKVRACEFLDVIDKIGNKSCDALES